MPELTREEKLKLVEKLPQRLLEFMYSEDTGAALLSLGQKYNLPNGKVHLLSKLTGDVVLGIKQVASLAQEIYSNILPDTKLAMDLAQELYADVLAPALMPAPEAPTTPPSTTPAPAPTAPRPTAPPTVSKVEPSAPSADRYREPAYAGGPATPEVVDLRRSPPAVSKVEPPATPKPATPPTPTTPNPPKPVAPPAASRVEPPPTQRPAMPLIEAEPHKTPVSIPTPTPLSRMPQVILRPPGLPPTDLPRDILDLRKDKGEF